MFGIGPTELIVILVIALIVVGPERLPQLAGQVGKAIRDFRQMSGDMTGEFQRAFQLDEPPAEPPVLTDQVIPASATPNGNPDHLPALIAQVVPSEPPIAPIEPDPYSDPAPTAEDTLIATEPVAANGHQPVATKADPLVDVSFLDDPEPEPEPAPEATTTYESMPVASFAPPDEDTPKLADPIADGWDAVMTTSATISLPEPSPAEEATEAQPEPIGTAVALAEPPAAPESAPEATLAASGETTSEVASEEEPRRQRVDPSAEVTIREVIEGQVAAEAFRERRRIATYRRHR